MKKLLKKVLLLGLVSIPGLFGRTQNVYSQTSLHDSLRHLLAQIEEKTKDETLIKAVKDAKALYTSNSIDDSLSKKLLIVDSLLVNAAQLNQKRALFFATTLVQLLKHLPPKQEHPDYATSLKHLADLYYYLGQYNNALTSFKQALAIRKKVLGEEHPDYASSLADLAVLYSEMRQYEKALPLNEQSIAIRKKVLGEDHPDYASSLYNLASLYSTMGHYEKALPLLEQSLAIRKRVLGEEHLDYGNSLSDLAFVYFSLNQYEKALPLFQQSILITEKKLGKEDPQYTDGLNNLATLYISIGQYDKALPIFQQCLAITRKVFGEESPNYAIYLNNLSTLYANMGFYEKALPLNEQALTIDKKKLGEENPNYAASLNNLGVLYERMGHYDKALPLCEQALAIIKKTLGERHPNYAINLHSLGFLYEKMSQYDKAIILYKQSLTITKRILGEAHPEYAKILMKLANLYYEKGQYKNALPLTQQALSIIEKTLGREHPNYTYISNNLGLLYSSLGNPTAASVLLVETSILTLRYLRQIYSTLSEEEKMNFLKNNYSQFHFLSSLLFTQDARYTAAIKQVYANELVLKGMVLEDQQQVLRSIRKSGDSSFLSLFEKWRLNKAFLGKQLLLPIAKRVLYFDSLQEITNQLEQQLSRRTTVFLNQIFKQTITAKDISQKLLSGQAAIEFIKVPLYNRKWTDSVMYAALVLLPKDSIAKFIPLFEEKQLQSLLKSSSKQVTNDAAIRKLYAENSLYQLIWKPLEKYLTGVHTVYYAPAGLLHRIAFQALRADSSHLLIDKYQVNQVLSTRSVALPSLLTKKPASAGMWGNIQYGLPTDAITSRSSQPSEGEIDTTASFFNFYTSDTRKFRGKEWRSLTGTKQEMESITKELSQAGTTTAIDSGTLATEEAFKALDGKSPQVLHLATHGFFLPVAETKPNDNSGAGNNVFTVQQNPMFRSGLVLAGANHAWLGGAAIPGKEDGILTAYEISQIDLSNTDLVVLSACETALGDLKANEGVIGLQRAFKMAGVKQMIISLWEVPDKETAELMSMFYHNWLSGQSTREALRSAQLKMKEKYPPYFWAAFAVVE